jgi:hypothetical protein
VLARERSRYWETLCSFANQLVRGESVPLDVSKFCKEMAIGVSEGAIPGKARAVVLQGAGGIEIRIQCDGTMSPVRRRFLIAHELGHIVLQRHCAASPVGHSDYWQHEQLCDDFAGKLLVPDELLRKFFHQRPSSIIGLLARTNQLAQVALVPWQTAANRVSEIYPRTGLFVARRTGGTSDRTNQIKVVSSSLPRKTGQGRTLSAETTLGMALDKLVRPRSIMSLDSCHLIEVTKEVRSGSRAGAAYSAGSGEFRLAARLKPPDAG